MLLAACATPAQQLARSAANQHGSECLGPDRATCFFRNSPVRLSPEPVRLQNRSVAFYPTAQPLDFVDGQGLKWVAGTRTLTDGASIPQVFIPVIGDPRSREFANAAALHDAYCGIGNEDGSAYHADSWQNVHRMFYDTLIVSGTPELKAKVMFAAVWLAGPRWGVLEGSRFDVPDRYKINAMQQTVAFINANNPGIPRLVQYMGASERHMKRLAALDAHERNVAPLPVKTTVKPAGTGNAATQR